MNSLFNLNKNKTSLKDLIPVEIIIPTGAPDKKKPKEPLKQSKEAQLLLSDKIEKEINSQVAKNIKKLKI